MEQKKTPVIQEDRTEALVRILGQDIPASRNIYTGLTKIKGISWSIANAICIQLNLDKYKKIGDLDKPTISKIEKAMASIELPVFLKNRRADLDSGEHKHLLASDLDIQKEFDIKRLKKMKSYKGVRHALGQPVRGQRTRSHFRKRGASVGVRKKDEKKT